MQLVCQVFTFNLKLLLINNLRVFTSGETSENAPISRRSPSLSDDFCH